MHNTYPSFTLFAIPDFPEVRPNDSLSALIKQSLLNAKLHLAPYDIIVVAQKIVSKSEGRFVKLSTFPISKNAQEIAETSGKNPHKVQAILEESACVMRVTNSPPNGTIIVRHKQGWVCANAGIDESNLGPFSNEDTALLLPKDPNASAQHLQNAIEKIYGTPIGVVISDTFGRAWRKGQVNVALGLSGIPAIIDLIGKYDAYGRLLTVTQPAFADELAAAAGLLMQKASSTPVVVIRGLKWQSTTKASANDFIRSIEEELFT